ncbi:sigma 54-interacting transcriptional regulator [Lachnospiraceae bacterium 54-53]
MSGIAVFLPNEAMCRQADKILSKRKNHVIVNRATTINNIVEEVRKAIEQGANIVVARGHQASNVKKYTSMPTVEVVMTAQELGLLIVKAKKLVNRPFPRIGIFCWAGMLSDTTYFDQLHEVRIVTYHLNDEDDWYERVEHAISDGVDVLIGGEKCVRYAAQKNFPAVYLSTTGESIEIAINQAETIYDMAEFEKNTYAQFTTVLDSSFNGIIKIGVDGLVQTMNRVMENMLKTSVKAAVGLHITELLPSMDPVMIQKLLTGQEETYSTFISNDNQAIVIIAEPIVVDNHIFGAIISCNRTMRLNWSEDKMKEKFLTGFVAYEHLDHLLSRRPGLKDAVNLAKIYAQSNSPILVEGSSSDEQEQFCQGIHNYSLRKNGPFVVVNIENIPVSQQLHSLFGISEEGFDKKQKGSFMKAGDGTLVIREIEKMSLSVQKYVLGVIRKNRFSLLNIENESVQVVDTRVIACTGADLRELVNQGRFNKNLYYLLRAFTITLPKSGDRKEDLEILLDGYYQKYLERYSRYHILTPEARAKILDFPWDNNDIQLESFCERMILTANKRKITSEYVLSLLSSLYDLSEKDEEEEIGEMPKRNLLEEERVRKIQAGLLKYNGNRMITAQSLGISKSTLWRYMKKYNLM